VVPELGWALKQGGSEKLLHKDTIQFGFPHNTTFHGDFLYHISSPTYVVRGLV